MHFVIHFYSDHIIVVPMLLKYAGKCYEFDASKHWWSQKFYRVWAKNLSQIHI